MIARNKAKNKNVDYSSGKIKFLRIIFYKILIF